MPRSRKQPVPVVVVEEVKVPEVLVTRQQYIQDIKVRWQIHQYEVNNLVEDVKNALNFLTKKYQEVSAKFVTN